MSKRIIGALLSCAMILSCVGCSSSSSKIESIVEGIADAVEDVVEDDNDTLETSNDVTTSKLSYDYSSIEVPFDSSSLDCFNQPIYIYGDKFICGTSTLQDFIDAGYLEDDYSDEVISPDDDVADSFWPEASKNHVTLQFTNFTETDLSVYDCILSHVSLRLRDSSDTTVFSLGFSWDITPDMLSDATLKNSNAYEYGQWTPYTKYSKSGYQFKFYDDDDENKLSEVSIQWYPEPSEEEATAHQLEEEATAHQSEEEHAAGQSEEKYTAGDYHYEEAEYDDSWTFSSDSIDFQNMVFYYKGNKVTLGETTLNEFLALGVECTQDIDPTYVVGKHQVGTYKFRLSESKTMTVKATNYTNDDLEFGDCVISDISVRFNETDNIMQRQSYNALSFDFPMNITEEQVTEVEYDRDRVSRHSSEDEEGTTYDFIYYVKSREWTRDYYFQFDLDGNIISITLCWYPEN